MQRARFLVLLVAAFTTARTCAVSADDWYVAVNGASFAKGTKSSPLDLETALAGKRPIAPGDTVWIGAGCYKHPDRTLGSSGFGIRLAGQEGRPIRIRGESGGRVTVDGGITVHSPSTHLWLQDLEILVSENFTLPRAVSEPGSHPQSYNRPWGGLTIHSGTKCVYLNLVIHHNAQGVSFWSGATDSELNGCMIYDNGWEAPDRGHGHAIYTQNETGTKTIRDCIMTGGFGYTLHAYGSSRAYVDHYLAERNICYDAGPFLIGGGRPSKDIRVVNNFLFNVDMRIGYSAPENDDCEVIGNTIVNGGLKILNYRHAVNERNLVLDREATRPAGEPARVELLVNRYDPQRCHVAVFNWARQPQVEIDPTGFLRPGDRYRLLDPRGFYGEPVVEGAFDGKPLRVTVAREFAAFVLMKGE